MRGMQNFITRRIRSMTAIHPRRTALLQGKKFYETGIPCEKGHAGPRYVSTAGCVECAKAAATKIRQKFALGKLAFA